MDGCNGSGPMKAQRQEAKLDTMLNELTSRANHVKRLAKTVNRSLYSQNRREEEEKVIATAPTPPPEYPVDTVLGGIEQAGNAIVDACDELERTLEKVREVVGEAGILY